MKKVVLVTGAAAGIGKATALKFAEKGYRVALCDLDKSDVEAVHRQIKDLGGESIFRQCDVADPKQVESFVDYTVNTFGQLDAACNNAGIEGTMNLTADYKIEEWDHVLNINLRGQWLCMKYELPQMIERGGAIVNISSILGKVATPMTPAYTTSKHGLVGLTKAAALDYADKNIRVNAVCPGYIDTPMLERAGISTDSKRKEATIALHPIGRLGTAQEIANAIFWLASEEASFITGHTLMVDGGYTAQ